MHKILKISLLAMFVMSFAIAFAQDDQGMPPMEKASVTVASDQQPFWLYIDDARQNQEPVKSIRVEGVPEGKHKLRVEIDNENRNVVGQMVEIQQSNNSYWVDKQHNMYGISLGRSVQNPEAIVPFVFPEQRDSYTSRPRPRHEEHRPSHTDKGYRPDGPFYPDRPDLSHRSSYSQRNNPMEAEKFYRAFENISRKTFEADKLSAAKQLIARNMMNIEQIKQICRLFEYESSKLDFAKSAYNHCTEKDSYYQINEVFQFENSKTELEQYVQQQQQQQESETGDKAPIDK